jgi:hypothetical protein
MRASITASPNGGSFPLRTTLELQGSFTLDKVPADPTTVALILTPPNSALRKYIQGSPVDGLDITRIGTGFYVFAFTPAVSGLWLGTWQGAGAVTATRDFSFSILPSANVPG